ncbi:MAG: TIGR04282 family arsenosugar biosynthesis glycosyltransferase [Mariprofundaceae bacterium]
MGGLRGMDKPRVIIMCKAPVAGQVKTRLMRAYSAAEAAAIHTAMATTVIERALRLFDDVVIAADDPAHPFFSRFDAPVIPQGEGDLGARMIRLMHDAFKQGAASLMFLGTDSPHIPDTRLVEAAAALAANDVVLGPVEDGGYDLVATGSDWPIFADVAWSTASVLDQTLANIKRLGLNSKLLASSFDIDTPEDLARAEDSGWCREGNA